MGDKISEVLDSMTAGELAALEGELDKRASELAVGHYYSLGVEAARREFAAFKGSGELTPLLHLVKAAAEPPDGKIRAKFKEMAQGKATPQELKEVATAQAGKEAAEDEKSEEKEEEKKEDEKSEKKLPPWLKGKGKDEEKSKKDEEKEEEKKEDEKKSSDIETFLEKASAAELVEFERALDAELLVKEYAAFYADCGRKLAREVNQDFRKEAVRGLLQAGPIAKGLGWMAQQFAPLTAGRRAFAGLAAGAVRHPHMAAAATGVGGTLVGQKLLSR